MDISRHHLSDVYPGMHVVGQVAEVGYVDIAALHQAYRPIYVRGIRSDENISNFAAPARTCSPPTKSNPNYCQPRSRQPLETCVYTYAKIRVGFLTCRLHRYVLPHHVVLNHISSHFLIPLSDSSREH